MFTAGAVHVDETSVFIHIDTDVKYRFVFGLGLCCVLCECKSNVYSLKRSSSFAHMFYIGVRKSSIDFWLQGRYVSYFLCYDAWSTRAVHGRVQTLTSKKNVSCLQTAKSLVHCY